jgi:hypothetical protein
VNARAIWQPRLQLAGLIDRVNKDGKSFGVLMFWAAMPLLVKFRCQA